MVPASVAESPMNARGYTPPDPGPGPDPAQYSVVIPATTVPPTRSIPSAADAAAGAGMIANGLTGVPVAVKSHRTAAPRDVPTAKPLSERSHAADCAGSSVVSRSPGSLDTPAESAYPGSARGLHAHATSVSAAPTEGATSALPVTMPSAFIENRR